MITTVNPSLSMYAPKVACGPMPKEEPPAPPAPPDQVDFGVIDTPAKAAAVPALDPALQLGLAAGVAAAIMAGMGGGSMPLITFDLATKTAGQDGNLSLNLDFKDEKNPVSTSGTFAGQPTEGRLVFNEETQEIGWDGTIGGNVERIRLTGMDEENKAASVSVQFGEVSGNLAFSAITGENEEDFKGYRVSGELGGQPYQVDTLVNIPEELKNGEPPEDGKIEIGISSNGSIGDQAIAREYKVEAQMTGGGLVVNIAGGGNVAGIATELNGALTIVP